MPSLNDLLRARRSHVFPSALTLKQVSSVLYILHILRHTAAPVIFAVSAVEADILRPLTGNRPVGSGASSLRSKNSNELRGIDLLRALIRNAFGDFFENGYCFCYVEVVYLPSDIARLWLRLWNAISRRVAVSNTGSLFMNLRRKTKYICGDSETHLAV